MRYWYFLLLLCISTPLFSQTVYTDFKKIDDHARSFERGNLEVEAFARKLTAPFDTDLEKVRAIFSWIAEHIEYDCTKFRKGSLTIEFSGRSQEEIDEKIRAYEEAEMERTLRKKKGICHDYSYLFVRMCEAIGIRSEVVGGFARTSRFTPSQSNHAWNAVQIDGGWGLLDVTWGAGTVNNDATRFVKMFRDEYFLPRPEDMIFTHFPEEEKWQLLDTPFSMEEYRAFPELGNAYLKYRITDLEPFVARIKAPNERMEISFRAEVPIDTDLLIVAGNPYLLDVSISVEDNLYTIRLNDPREIQRQKYLVVGLKSDGKYIDPIIVYDVR
jgi:transglutaminase/protease-like cytokinesis protein 3